MREQFTIVYKGKNFQFELDKKDGRVWLINDDELKTKSNHGQVIPAKNIKEAREIAEIMLYTMGL